MFDCELGRGEEAKGRVLEDSRSGEWAWGNGWGGGVREWGGDVEVFGARVESEEE